MRIAPVAIGAPFLLSLLTWLLVNGLDLNSNRFDRELQALDDFSRFERGFTREVLAARVGLSRNYDALVRMMEAYDNSLDRLREAAGPNAEENAPIEVLAATADRQEKLIEQFKTRNALLHNSFAYFGMLSAHLAASDHEPVVAVTTTLAAAMLRLTLDTSVAAAREVQNRLNELASLQRPPGDADTIQAVIAHGGVLHDLLPETDAALKALVASASNGEQEGEAPACRASLGRSVPPVSLRHIPVAARRAGISRAAITGTRDRAAAACRVRARDRRDLDAFHQHTAANYRCRDRSGSRRYG